MEKVTMTEISEEKSEGPRRQCRVKGKVNRVPT